MTSRKSRVIIDQAIKQASAFKNKVGTSPTLRGIFYALVSVEAMPNTKVAYKGLSRLLSDARKEGVFPWGLMKDETRRSLGGDEGNSLDQIEHDAPRADRSYLDELSTILGKIRTMAKNGLSYPTLKWAEQPERVIICLEKDTLADAIHSLTRKWGIEIHVLRGYSSTTHLKALADDIDSIDAEVSLLLLTDCDPTGQDIVRHLSESLSSDFEVECDVEKIAVTVDQVKIHNLPAIPEDADERAKMQRDPRFKSWPHGFFRVELDALMAIVPNELRLILDRAIAERFDLEIEEMVHAETEKLEEVARARLVDLSSKLGSAHELVSSLREAQRDELDD